MVEVTANNNWVLIRESVVAKVVVMTVVSRVVGAAVVETGVVDRESTNSSSNTTHQPLTLGEAETGAGGTGVDTGTILIPGSEVVTAGDTSAYRYDRDTTSDRDIEDITVTKDIRKVLF